MKVYCNSFYVLGSISCIAFGVIILIYFYPKLDRFYDICLGVFASALITAVSSLVCYFDQKQKIITALTLKSASMFGTLCSFIRNPQEYLNTDKELQNLVHWCNMLANAIKQQDLIYELTQYVPFGKYKQVKALWNVETNLVQEFPRLASVMNKTMCLYDKAVLCNDLVQAKHYEAEIKDLYKQLNDLAVSQRNFLDSILYVLYSDKKFNEPWEVVRQKLYNQAKFE